MLHKSIILKNRCRRIRRPIRSNCLQPTPNRTFADKDVPVFLPFATPMVLAVLLTLQSVVPCCAISKLLISADRTEAGATHPCHPCSCCPDSRSQQEPIPSDDGHSPDAKCPFCGGLLFHSALDDAAPIPEGYSVFTLPGDTPRHASVQAAVFPQIIRRQILGQPFLNTGTRLLI